MNAEKLRQVLDYCDVYEFIAAGTDSMKSLDGEMRGGSKFVGTAEKKEVDHRVTGISNHQG